MTIELTVKEVAERERVDEQTVYRWICKGALVIRRTPGGRIRILYEASTTEASPPHS